MVLNTLEAHAQKRQSDGPPSWARFFMEASLVFMTYDCPQLICTIVVMAVKITVTDMMLVFAALNDVLLMSWVYHA